MKLIDSDNQADLITKFILTHKDKIIDILQSGDNDFLFSLMMQYFDAQKADYDVKKVVEQLEELHEMYLNRYGVVGNSSLSAIKRAIEIVKQGGVGTDDVCEWQMYDYKTICSPHERDWSIPAMKDFMYCPYCGKKIKVVE